MTVSEQQRWRRAKEIFEAACEEQPSSQQRIILEMAAGDMDLASDVQRLLSLQNASGLTLDSPAQPLGPGMYAPGEVLSDRYRIDRYLSSGGMGDVYSAWDTRTGQRVAVKFVRPFAASQRDIEARFLREVRLAQKIVHPNVCRMIALDMHNGVRYCVMELLEGRTLADLLQSCGRMTPEEALPIALQLCDALQAAHQAGVLHRDIKPGNIFLVGDRALLIDFGLASAMLREGSLTSAGVVIGTLAYVAPEQLEQGKASPASDIYSLGVVLHEMLMGRKPHEAKSPFRLARQKVTEVHEGLVRGREIPPLWSEVLTRCLKARPEVRYQSALEVRKALERGRPSVRFHFGKRSVWGPVIAAVIAFSLWIGWLWARADYKPPAAAASLYDDAAAAMARSSPVRAVALLQQAVAVDTNFVKAIALLAVAHAESDQLDKARQSILQATISADRRWLLGRGERHALDGARAAVVRDFPLSADRYGQWAAIAIGHERANALLFRGRMQDQAGMADEALATFQLAVQEQPGNPAAHIRLALQLCRRLQFAPAARHFSAAERILRAEQNLEGLTELLLARDALRTRSSEDNRRDLEEAEALVKRTENQVHRLELRFRLASIALRNRDYEGAAAIARGTVEEARRNGLEFIAARALGDLGHTYQYAHQPERAVAILSEAVSNAEQVKSYQMLAENRIRLGEVLASMDRREEAIQHMAPAVEWYRTGRYYDVLPFALIKYGTALGDVAGKSRAIFVEALRTAQREGNITYQTMALQRLMRDAGPIHLGEAVSYANQLLPLAKAMPHHRALIQIAEQLRDAGNIAEAKLVVKEAEDAIARYPDGVDREYLHSRAQVFHAEVAFIQQDCDQGLKLLDNARADTPEVQPTAGYLRIHLRNCAAETPRSVLEQNLRNLQESIPKAIFARRLQQLRIAHAATALRLKRWNVARQSAREGIGIAAKTGEHTFRFTLQLLLRAAERQSGNAAAADQLTAPARALASQIGLDEHFNGRKDLQAWWRAGSE